MRIYKMCGAHFYTHQRHVSPPSGLAPWVILTNAHRALAARYRSQTNFCIEQMTALWATKGSVCHWNSPPSGTYYQMPNESPSGVSCSLHSQTNSLFVLDAHCVRGQTFIERVLAALADKLKTRKANKP